MKKGLSTAFASDEYDAKGVTFFPLAQKDGFAVTIARFEAGASIGEHPAAVPQLFHVVAGKGWVSGATRERSRIKEGEHVIWESGERHASGTSSGMVAMIVQSDDPEAFSVALG